MTYYERIPGTKDYVGFEANQLIEIADICSSIFSLYGYEPIILPILEHSNMFLQHSGKDIRSKIYTLRDPKGREICLRPEITISVARAFLETMTCKRLPVRLNYQGDVFRYDRISEGRYRQFLQVGAECIGGENLIETDVEAVTLALEAIKKVGIAETRLVLGDLELTVEFINSLPILPNIRSRIIEKFWHREAFSRLLKHLSESTDQNKKTTDISETDIEKILYTLGNDASHFLIKQILSLFVEKEIGQRDLNEIADKFLQKLTNKKDIYLPNEHLEALQEYFSISGSPDETFQQLEKLLQKMGATPGKVFEKFYYRLEKLKKRGIKPESVQVDLNFRRTIDYYTGFIFEIHCDELGTVSQICGGGRYDRLFSSLGASRDIPAIGFAIGANRLLLALKKNGVTSASKAKYSIDAALITIGQVSEDTAWEIAQVCRQAGWKVRAEIDSHRLGAVLSHISSEKIPFTIIVGEDELKENNIKIKDMFERKEEMVSIDQLKDYVSKKISSNKASELSPISA